MSLLLLGCVAVGLLILGIMQWNEEGKSFKFKWPLYAFATVIGVVAVYFIDSDAVRAVSIIAVILLSATIYRFIAKIKQ